MEEQLTQLRALAFFANQMLICAVANTIRKGAYDPATAQTNVHEVIDQATRTLSPEHMPFITKVAAAYNEGIDKAVADSKREG
jgi:hypothetical protein